ncbi:acyl-CoA carboxylase epsilon subunit [Streptomyces sp. NPDC052012]|uniref:acyl-CoA carboxylase epsilon subunit n=1 Tax=Streptomyces sp. NPDC052012 TaxID=3155051 RepID=UPI00344F8FC3
MARTSRTPSAPPFEGPLGPALFRVVGGSPTPEEVAAVAALLTALATAPAESAAESSSGTPDACEPAPARWHRPAAPPPASWRART